MLWKSLWFSSILFFISSLLSFSQNGNQIQSSSTNNRNLITDKTSKEKIINDYLITFIDSGRFDIVSYLLMKGADPNYIDSLWLTPLMVSSMQKDTNITKLLIKKGAKINFRNIRLENALQWALISKQPEQLKILIANNSELNITDVNGIAPFFYALGYGAYDLISYFDEDYVKNHPPNTSYSET